MTAVLDDSLKAAAKHLAVLDAAARSESMTALGKAVRMFMPQDQVDAELRLKVEDLNDVDADDIPATLWNLVVEAQVNWFAGHPGSAKTTLAMRVALEVIREGRDVLWLDWEGGRAPSKRRLIALGATAEEIAKIRYVYAPRLGADGDSLEKITATLESLQPGALIVFDSASKALSAAGLSEDGNQDVTDWTTKVIMPLREYGTVIVIDHVIKSATKATPYARGAGAKLADTEVMWYVEAQVPFNRSQAGVLRLTKHKDREGVLPEELRFSIGDGAGMLPIEPLEEDQTTEENQKVRRALRGLLAENDGAELSGNQVFDAHVIGGRKSLILDELARLANDASEPVSRRAGPRNSWLYSFDADAGAGLTV